MRARGLSTFVAIVVVVGLAACGGGDDEATGTASTTTSSGTDRSESSATASASSNSDADATATVRIYFLRNGKLGPVGRDAPATRPATTAVNQLLMGPSQEEAGAGLATSIPLGVELNGIAIANKVATVDLSKSFEEGADQPTMQQRIAQVVYSVRQFPTISGVLFKIDGYPVTSLAGVPVDHPQTRDDWESLQPAINIGTPLPFATVTSPIHVAGSANTFEATFRLEVTDSSGAVLVDSQVTATSGSGTRGSFDTSLTFAGGAKGPITLTGYEVSQENGQPTNTVDIPLQLG